MAKKAKQNLKQTAAVGNCLKASFTLLFNYKHGIPQSPKAIGIGLFGEPRWVHGLVWHKDTDLHCHAWIEDDFFCYDFASGNEFVVMKEDYYRIGRIMEPNLVRYDYLEGARLVHKTGEYQFYDPKFDNFD